MFEKFAEDVYKRYLEKLAVLDNPNTYNTLDNMHGSDQQIPQEEVYQAENNEPPVIHNPSSTEYKPNKNPDKNSTAPKNVLQKIQQSVGNVYNQMGNYYFNKAKDQENQIREMLKRIENMPYDPEQIEQTEFMKNMNNEMNNTILKQMQQQVNP